jgi:adenine specific DNA methylase Mod
MTKEQKFYKALQDVFIGAKIEGQGGFVNLMKIKSNYYKKIEELLKADVEKGLDKYPSFRDELFDKLYSFFSRYFTESGSIYFNSTPFHNNIYEKVYTDDKDVILFWKTQMLYYVKTDRIFRSLEIESDGFKFYFDVSKLEHKKANEKRSLIFELDKIKEDKTIVFNVQYSERGTKTKQDEILKAIKKKGIAITEEQLERAFRVFEKQSEVDFFINKNAKAFLQEQFKLWSYQYFWEGAKEWGADRVNQLQILKDIAFKIIDFISQFEDELVKIWNKPKFVKNSNYVITLDRIKDEKLIKKILKHKNITKQIKEWQVLGIVDEKFKTSDVFESDLTRKHLSKKYEHLPIDTKYFKDLELEILSLFDDLDKSLDGWLIKSENYQALNTILPKFKEKVQTIYIDPPFNTGNDFDYVDRFQDSSWLSLMENRISIGKQYLKKEGAFFLHLDYNADYRGRELLERIFSEENFRNEIIWTYGGKGLINVAKKFSPYYSSVFFFAKDKDKLFVQNRQIGKITNSVMQRFGKLMDDNFQITFGKLKEYNEESEFKKARDRFIAKFDREPEDDDVAIDYSEKGSIFKDVWNDIGIVRTNSKYKEFFGFETQKPEQLLRRMIETTSKEGDLVLDFFLGIGTTTAVAHKLDRKWIGVEMGDHIYSFNQDGGKLSGILTRMKEVLAGQGNHEPCGISRDINWQGGGFFKYYELEQYEEALANCKYEDGDLFTVSVRSPYQEYVFLKDEKMLKALEIDYENNKVKVDLSKLYPNIDIAETLSNLTGKWIKKISADEVEFEDGTKINIKDLDYKLIKPLIWWE